MKKVTNTYVNYGIAFSLLGILVFSLAINPLKGFEEGYSNKKKATAKKETSAEEANDLKETLSQLQHLAHLAKKDKSEKYEAI